MNCTASASGIITEKANRNKMKVSSSKDYVENGPVLIEDDENDQLSKTEDDYEIYKKLKQQADLVDHLDQLETEYGRGKGGSKAKNVIYKSDQDFLDSLMKESSLSSSKNRFESDQGARKPYTTKSTTATSQPKIKFHGTS